MFVKSLAKMEKIVDAKSNLEWDGWTVVEYKKDGSGFLKTDGAFRNGQWTVRRRYEPQREGWNVPKAWNRFAQWTG